ncbi:MAG: PH domain-containing protein [Phycisphaerae bacterium]|jgi:hypothetical protein
MVSSNKSGNSEFTAPWGTLLKILTAVLTIILIGISYIGFSSGRQGSIVTIFVPLAILIISSFFIIRGYILTDNTLLIQRLGWNTKINLSELKSAEIDPTAMAKSLRTFGNGGMFCFAGLFYNKKLGSYRAFATDFKKAVILRFPNRTIVVTPNEPEKFVMKIKEFSRL